MRSTTIALTIAIIAGSAPAAWAHGGHGGGFHEHGGFGMRGGHDGAGRRHGNNPHMKAAVKERDKLLDELQNLKICKGC